jgi:phosphoribosylanthranilate isomerase
MGDSSIFLRRRSHATSPSDNHESVRSREYGQSLIGLLAAQHRIGARERQARVRALKSLREKPDYLAATKDVQLEREQAVLETVHQKYTQQAQAAEKEYTDTMRQAANLVAINAIPVDATGDEEDALEMAGRAVYERMIEGWFGDDDEDEEVCLPHITA